MKKVLPRFALVLAVMLSAEAAAFAVYNRDLLALRSAQAMDGRTTDELRQHAAGALARTRLTRQHLETIATLGQRLHMQDLEVGALERIHAMAPAEDVVSLRLADAYRRARRYREAESLYRQLLNEGSASADVRRVS